MDEDGKNPLARLEKQRPNYLLIAASATLVILLIAGVAMSVRAQVLVSAVIFLSALAVFAVLILANVAANRRLAAVDDRKFIHWDAAFPELQRQNVNVEVRELARQLKVGEEQMPELLSAYIVAEDLALRQIQQEENLPLMRHVSIGKTPFDGVLIDRDRITCIEVAFLVVPDVRQEKVDSMLKKITQAAKNLVEMKSRLRLRLMVVLVTQLTPDDDELLQTTLVKRRFKDMQVDDVEIRMLDFEMLQKLYVSEL